ncbi:MAG: glycoside hydrolase family 3 N-terminal domain-containing protein [Cyanobacteria bacterium P01_H01_bin.74]
MAQNGLTTQENLFRMLAQLMVVGYSGKTLGEVTKRFIDLGVGGLIFFRENFQHCQSPAEIKKITQGLYECFPADCLTPLFSIDQEGGQVERLPHTCFPTGPNPLALALSENPESLAKNYYETMARQLVDLGFWCNFFPTVDLNSNPDNPIIGVRSFGDNPETVQRLSGLALQQFKNNGLIGVAKHFPGHGNGQVDSHLDLPVIHFSPEEMACFQHSIQHDVPGVLVAHALYPELQPSSELDAHCPASASPTILNDILRRRCGFSGVIFSDDMCMGAITRYQSAPEAAVAAIQAGIDMLIYKQSTKAEWTVLETLIAKVSAGEIPLAQITDSVARIEALKQRYSMTQQGLKQPSIKITTPPPSGTVPDSDEMALEFAHQATTVVKASRINTTAFTGNNTLEPTFQGILRNARILLIHPDRGSIVNYAFDSPTSPDLDTVLTTLGFANVTSIPYNVTASTETECQLSRLLSRPLEKLASIGNPTVGNLTGWDWFVFVTFTPTIHRGQVDLFQQLYQKCPAENHLVVSAGMPTPVDGIHEHCSTHIVMASYRPAAMTALAECLLNPNSVL